MRCQSKVNCSSQVCWRQVNLQGLWLQKEEKDDEFDGCLGCLACESPTCSALKRVTNHVLHVKMTRFGYRVDLFRERHVRVKNEAKIASRETDWDDIIAER